MSTTRTAYFAIAVSSIALLGQAQDPAPAKPSPKRDEQQAPSAPQNTRRYTTGTLRELDPEARTVAFQDASGKVQTWPVDERIARAAVGAAQRRLNVLKPGDAIRVIYHLDESGKPKVIDIGRYKENERREGEEGRPATAPAPPEPPR